MAKAIRCILLSVGCICGGVLLAVLMYDCSTLEDSTVIVQPKNIALDVITLPYQLPGTDVVIRNFVAYEGGEDVSEILAVVLENIGQEWIATCNVQILEGGTCFTFTATMLPPDSRTLVMESAGSKYRKVEINHCEGQACYLPAEQRPITDVRVDPVDMGCIRVINTSDYRYDLISIFYKAYDRESGLYLNGLARKELVHDLLPGEERMVYPAHYAGKYSRILILTAEEIA